MEKELKYIAPEMEIVSAQVEKGFAESFGQGTEGPGEGGQGWM